MPQSARWKRLLNDSVLVESLAVSLVVLLLTAGLSLVVSWLWVLGWAQVRGARPTRGAILVFGHQLVDGHPSPDFRRRLQRAAELCRSNHSLRLILLGGGQPSEAAAGRDWLVAEQGMDPHRIELEQHSIDSFENLRNARDMAVEGEPVYLLSSRYHLGRLMVYARQLDISGKLLPAESVFVPNLRNLVCSVREAAYLCWFCSGRLWAWLARRERLLVRLR
jgi:uncharacterized SAM-binding protein YcdF (DUF218 family)